MVSRLAGRVTGGPPGASGSGESVSLLPGALQVDTASSSAIAGPPSRRLVASCRAVAADSRPATTMSSPPPLALMAARPPDRSVPREVFTTASESSSTSSNIPGAATAPVSVMSWPSMPPRATCTPIDAAALTANSKDEATPLPACALRRVSSSSIARFRHRCSSRRTISSP
jgi:hypothetical protein